MTAEWRPDPMGRADWRYFDGAEWTRHVATSGDRSTESPDLPLPTAFPGSQAVPAWAMAPQRKGGRLIAAGVLAIVSGAFTLLVSIGYLAALSLPLCADAAPGVHCRDAVLDDSGTFKALMILTLVMAGFLIAGGIGGCMRRFWGQSMLIATAGAVVVLDVVVMAYKYAPSTLINIGWCALIIGLARANNRADYEMPR